jgi:hypothetical protein
MSAINKILNWFMGVEQTDGAIPVSEVVRRGLMCLPYGVSKRSSNAYVPAEDEHITSLGLK